MERPGKIWRAVAVLALAAALGLGAAALEMAWRAGQATQRMEKIQDDHGRLLMQLAGPTTGRSDEAAAGRPSDWSRGGRLVVRLRDFPATINPLRVADSSARMVCDLVCETLARADLDSNLEGPGDYRPGLATSWEISEDHLKYIFHLNKLAHFSDGEPVGADDVVFTLKALGEASAGGETTRADSAGSPRGAALGEVAEVRALDPLTVEVRYARPYFLAFQALAGVYILPRHVYDYRRAAEIDETPGRLAGSGPFVLDPETKFGPHAEEIVLRRNEAYWDRGRVAALDAVEFRLVEDDKRAYQMARTGGVDVTWLLPEQFREAQEEKDGNFLKHHRVLRSYLPEFGYLYIGWNMRPGPLADARVRRALTALAPRQMMIEEIYMGLARPMATPFWPDGRQNDPGLKPAAYDVAAAGAALEEAGWRLEEKAETPRRVKDGVGLKVTILAPKGGGRTNSLARMFAESAAKAGVEVAVEELRWPEMQERLAAGKFDGALMGWSGALEIDPYLFFHSSQTAAGGLNYIGFKSGEADRLCEAIRHELNREARNRLCHELAAVLEREQPYTLLLEPESVVAVGTKFKGVRSYRLGLRPEEWYVSSGEE